MANIGPKGKMDFKFVDLNGGGGGKLKFHGNIQFKARGQNSKHHGQNSCHTSGQNVSSDVHRFVHHSHPYGITKGILPLHIGRVHV